MATGAVSNLGLGSGGALSYDVIDKLRAADEASMVTPIDTKMENNQSKKSNLDVLISLMASVKTNTSSLSDELLYLGRDVSVTGDAVTASVSSGVSAQSLEIDVSKLAQKDVYQTAGFEDETDTVLSGATMDNYIKFTVDSASHSVEIDKNATLEEIAQAINDGTNGDVKASILNTGGANPYKLIVKSAESGADNAITIENSVVSEDLTAPVTFAAGELNIAGVDITAGTYNSIDDLITQINTDLSATNVSAEANGDGIQLNDSTGADIVIAGTDPSKAGFTAGTIDIISTLDLANVDNHVQTAQNAEFTYDGVSMSRASNEISDIITGLTINVEEVGSSTINITQDTDSISSQVESFVSNYNELTSQLDEFTKYDTDTKVSGIFQGDNTITSIKRDINKILLSVNSDGQSLIDYGVALNDGGILEFNSSTFNTKISEDADGLMDFFKGSTTYATTTVEGEDLNTGSIELAYGDFNINGTSIILAATGGGSTAEQNSKALRDAINDADIDNISAKLANDGLSVTIEGAAALDIEIDGNDFSDTGFSDRTIYGSQSSTEGVFSNLNDFFTSVATSSDSYLELYSDQLSSEYENLQTERERTMDLLDQRYETMATQFAAYDSIIAQFDAQFQSLQMQIEHEINND